MWGCRSSIAHGKAQGARGGFVTSPKRETSRALAICTAGSAEVLSPGTARYELVEKLRTLQSAGGPHYWSVDPEQELLTVHRLSAEGYVTALTAGVGGAVRAEPFEEVAISIRALFGFDEADR